MPAFGILIRSYLLVLIFAMYLCFYFFIVYSSEKCKYFYVPDFDGFYYNRLTKLVLQKIAAYVTGATFNRFVRFLNEAPRHQVLPETPRGEASFVKGRTIEDVECFI